VALNIAPYRTISREYRSVTGETIPVTLWVIPEHVAQGETLANEMLEHLRFFEDRLGPYPFRADKYGVAETPHLGMEHQTIIAYGNEFRKNADGYDELHQHELSHEWFANLITAKDWSDYWLHEGFGSYMQPLYAEKLNGREAYLRAIRAQWRGAKNRRPVAEPCCLTAGEVYFNPPDYLQGDGDIYGKGSVVLHTLRYVLGDSLFFQTIRRWLYPTPEWERVTDGSQVRLVTTDEFVQHVSRMAGRELRWFFEVYVRQPALPRLVEQRTDSTLALRWETPGQLPFPMPVEVEIDGKVERWEMRDGRESRSVPRRASVRVDPGEWVFRRLETGGA
jgi:aminopeptidase N